MIHSFLLHNILRERESKVTKRIRKINPYIVSYMSLAIVCCMVLSVIFMYVNIYNEKKVYENNNQKKVTLIAEEIDSILASVHDLALKLTINKHFHPFYFEANSYYEIVMVQEMGNYVSSYLEIDEAFLCYGEQKIFHSSGYTMNINTYIGSWGNEAKAAFLSNIRKPQELYFEVVDNVLYITQPFEAIKTEKMEAQTATLTVGIYFENLEKRLDRACSGIDGKVAILYQGKTIYDNDVDNKYVNPRNKITKKTENSGTIADYYPYTATRMNSMFPLWILSIISSVMLLLFVALMYAKHTYKAIEDMAFKFGECVSLPNEYQSADKLKEISNIMNIVLENNEENRKLLEQKQEALCNQVLRMLLSEHYFQDVYQYLERLDLHLPGPFYFVYSVLFQEKLSSEDISGLKKQLELSSVPQDNRYVYVVKSEYSGRALLNIICSLQIAEEKEEIVELLRETAGNIEYDMSCGCGSVCTRLSAINASYLESMDNIHKKGKRKIEYVGGQTDLCQVYDAIRKGDEDAALTAFQFYTNSVLKDVQSFLAQKIIYSNFLNEMARIAREEDVELLNSDISSIVSANNVEEFCNCGTMLIHNYCQNVQQKGRNVKKDITLQICEYIRMHFAEYNMSIERVVEELGISIHLVRKAVKERTGMTYKEYIVFLRMEYAKELLTHGNRTVLEISNSVGYNTTSFFIKTFKDITGLTPANYRNLYKKTTIE